MGSTNPISVFVLIPNTCVKKIRVDPSLKFSIFQRLFPSEKKRNFIYNGEVVDETKTLQNYNFKDGDAIVATPFEDFRSFSSDTISWLSITRDSFHFNERIQDYIKMDPLQLAKIKDKIQSRKNKNSQKNTHIEISKKSEMGFNLNIKEGGLGQVPLPII